MLAPLPVVGSSSWHLSERSRVLAHPRNDGVPQQTTDSWHECPQLADQSAWTSLEVLGAFVASQETAPFRENLAVFSSLVLLVTNSNFLRCQLDVICHQNACQQVSYKGQRHLGGRLGVWCQRSLVFESSLFQSPHGFNLTLKEACLLEQISHRQALARQSHHMSFCTFSKRC